MAGNPEIPKYAKTAPSVNERCQGRGFGDGLNIVNPPAVGSGGLPVEVTAGSEIAVQDNSNTKKWSHEVSYAPYQAVSVSLSVVAKAAAVAKSNPILKGVIIDEVNCTWAYNAVRDGDINTQTLVNTQSGNDPTLLASDRDHDYTGETITSNASITITGGDGKSQDSDSASITFGNYIAVGVNDPSLLFETPGDLQGIFNGLPTKTVRTSQAGFSFNAFGTNTEYMVIFQPASFGASEFTKGSFTGGYKRIHRVTRGGNDILTDEVIAGDTETQILIDNGTGHTEEFYVYMSEYPGRAGDKPTIMSVA